MDCLVGKELAGRQIQGIEVNVQVELMTSDDPQCSVLGPVLFNMSHLHRQ